MEMIKKIKVSRPWQREVGGWNGWTQKRTGGASSSSPSVCLSCQVQGPRASFLLFSCWSAPFDDSRLLTLLFRIFSWLTTSRVLWKNILPVSLARANSPLFFYPPFYFIFSLSRWDSRSSFFFLPTDSIRRRILYRYVSPLLFRNTLGTDCLILTPPISLFYWTMSPLH
jgi:hypothetical protein